MNSNLICLPDYRLPIHLLAWLPICLLTYININLYIYLYAYLITCPSVFYSYSLLLTPVYTYSPVYLSTCLPVYQYTCLSIYRYSVYLSTCLPIHYRKNRHRFCFVSQNLNNSRYFVKNGSTDFKNSEFNLWNSQN